MRVNQDKRATTPGVGLGADGKGGVLRAPFRNPDENLGEVKVAGLEIRFQKQGKPDEPRELGFKGADGRWEIFEIGPKTQLERAIGGHAVRIAPGGNVFVDGQEVAFGGPAPRPAAEASAGPRSVGQAAEQFAQGFRQLMAQPDPNALSRGLEQAVGFARSAFASYPQVAEELFGLQQNAGAWAASRDPRTPQALAGIAGQAAEILEASALFVGHRTAHARAADAPYYQGYVQGAAGPMSGHAPYGDVQAAYDPSRLGYGATRTYGGFDMPEAIFGPPPGPPPRGPAAAPPPPGPPPGGPAPMGPPPPGPAGFGGDAVLAGLGTAAIAALGLAAVAAVGQAAFGYPAYGYGAGMNAFGLAPNPYAYWW